MKNPFDFGIRNQQSVKSGKLIYPVLIFSFILNLIFTSSLFAQEVPIAKNDFFYSGGKKNPVRVSYSSIGLLAKDGVSASQIESLCDSLGLDITNEYPGGIFVASYDDSLSRQELVNRAREIRNDNEQFLAQTGLVITPIGAKAPLIGTDQFIAKFANNVDSTDIEEWNRANGVEIVRANPYVSNQYLLKLAERSDPDVLKMSNLYHESELTTFSHPNFVLVIDHRRLIPDDPLFVEQWHHHNTGQGGGTVDADIDADLAWDLTKGDANTIIAVIDDGFDMSHPDLTPNFWTNTGEIPDNGIDDDGNTYVDDIHGWDFKGDDSDPSPDSDDDHGTLVAGAAVARGNNSIGVSGSCPECGFMLIRKNPTVDDLANTFGYAEQMGADVITCSWTIDEVAIPTAIENAINDAASAGCVIFFAMNNQPANDCAGDDPDLSSLASVIGVSRSTNKDKYDVSGYGNCMDLLAPGPGCRSVAGGTGTLWATTTDRQGTEGWNNNNPGNCGCTDLDDLDYSRCFTGTSFSAPLAAGVAGLILSADPSLTRVQVQRLLQDCADKIEDSRGKYNPNTGFSHPLSGNATHGWGRLNAFEPVRIAAPSIDGGKDGVDIFLRDNRLDWGNTEQPSNTLFEPERGFIGHYQSMDIKVDAPPFQDVPTARSFDDFTDETPSAIAGETNRVYVRVRNRGPVTADLVSVKLHWAQFGTALPPLPGDFWDLFPDNSTNTTRWHPLNWSESGLPVAYISDLRYSGSSVANTDYDAAQIVQFDFPIPAIDPDLSNHFCLLAMIDSPQDRILPLSGAPFSSESVVDHLTPRDNNVTHRNYTQLITNRSDTFNEGFMVRNPTLQPVDAVLRLKAPQGWKIVTDQLKFDEPFALAPGQERLVRMTVSLPEYNISGDVTIIQESLDTIPPRVMGGVSYRFRGEAVTEEPILVSGTLSSYLTGTYDRRKGDNTIFHVINPTAKYLRVVVSFFDENAIPLNCICESLGPNDLLEIDAQKFLPEDQHGIVKIVSFHEFDNEPEIGIVGYQQQITMKKCFFFFKSKYGVSETILHAIPNKILTEDLKYILPVCRDCMK